MSDKEMNLAILNKLYEIADKVFNEGVNVKEGNYTASDLAKMKDSAFKDGYLETENKKVYDYSAQKIVEKDCFIAPMASVNVLSFVCSFCVVQIFALVAKFEKLASIGSKKRMFIKQKDNNEVLCTVKVLINKYYSKLSLHCANDDLRPIMRNVCLDIRNGRAAASDGHTMLIKGLDVVSTEHFAYDYNLPLVNGKDFKKMCSLAKSGSILTCKLVREPNGNTYWVSECYGYYSKTEANRYVNYSSVLPKINPDNLCTINEKTWKGISKWLKKNKGFNSIGVVIIKHKENDNRITFTINGMYDNHDGIEISCECENIPNKNFAIGLKIDSLLRFENFNFTLGRYANEALVYVGSLEVGMMMPMYIDDEYDGFRLSDGYIGAYDYCGFAESFDMPTNEPTEDVIPTKVDNVTTKEKECATEKKNEQTNKSAKVVPLDKPSNKFSFDAIGVNVGDTLTRLLMAQRLLQQKTIRLYSVENCLRYRDSAKSLCQMISEQRVIPIVGVPSSLRMVSNWKSYLRMRKRNHWYQAKKRLQPYLMIYWIACQMSIKRVRNAPSGQLHHLQRKTSQSAKKRLQPQRLWLSLSVFLYVWIFHRTICGWILQQTSHFLKL